jgi:beta-phosphoglucomutase-like phosphatase (HAD superfamily)
VERYSAQCGLSDGWRVVQCANGDASRAKPSPAPYLDALAALGLGPQEVVAFEDSATGVQSAKRAGIRCIAVSQPDSEVDEADLHITSFENVPLRDVLDALTAASRVPYYATAVGLRP